MYPPDYVAFRVLKQRTREMAHNATLQAKFRRVPALALRYRLAWTIGRSLVWLGKRLLVYGQAGLQHTSAKVMIGRAR